MKKWINKWLPIFFGCHQKPERSFWIKGKPMPICARCTGEMIGMIIAIFMYFFIDISWWINCILMIPLIADGTIQLFTKYESNNIKRLITGILFGIAFIYIFFGFNEFVVNLGKEIGYEYARYRHQH